MAFVCGGLWSAWGLYIKDYSNKPCTIFHLQTGNEMQVHTMKIFAMLLIGPNWQNVSRGDSLHLVMSRVVDVSESWRSGSAKPGPLRTLIYS